MGWDGNWVRSTSQATEVNSTAWNWDNYSAQLYYNDDWYRSLMNSDRPDELKQKIFMSRYRFGYDEMTRGVQTMIGVGLSVPLIFSGGLATASVTASWGTRVGSVVFDYSTQGHL